MTERMVRILEVLGEESTPEELKAQIGRVVDEIVDENLRRTMPATSSEVIKEIRVANLYIYYIDRPLVDPRIVSFDMWKDLFVEGCQVLEEFIRGDAGDYYKMKSFEAYIDKCELRKLEWRKDPELAYHIDIWERGEGGR